MTIQGYSKPSNCSLVIASYPNLNEDILTSGVPWVNALGGGAPSGKVTNARERSSRARFDSILRSKPESKPDSILGVKIE